MKAQLLSLTDLGLDRYREFLRGCDDALIYTTPEWLSFLVRVTRCETPQFIVVSQDGSIAAALPVMTIQSRGIVVANSLPYFGSHGDALVPPCPDAEERLTTLVDGIAGAIRSLRVGSINIVGHPLTPRLAGLTDRIGLRAWDRRVGQISSLSPAPNLETAIEEVLRACHQKTRNLVRKGLKSGFEIRHSTEISDWNQLALHHRLGMEKIGGRFKTPEQFEALRDTFEPSGMCRLYIAERDGRFAGGLLVLMFRDWVEYFTPVAVEEFRSEQVLSALIATAMAEASVGGARRWNWGGTWLTQSGVYHFKQGWGAQDHPYEYLGTVLDGAVQDLAGEEVRERFPFFYVKPL